MVRLFLKDSLIYAIPSFVSRGLSLFLVPLYTSVLTPSDYGSLDLLTVFSSIVNLTIALEVSQGVARFYSLESNPDKKIGYASSALWFTILIYALFTFLMLIFSPQLSGIIMGQQGLNSAFQVGMINLGINGIFYLVQNQLRWELRSQQYAIVSLVMVIVTAAFSVLFTYFLDLGLLGLLFGMTLGFLSASILGLFWLRTTFKFIINSEQLKEMLQFSSPLVFSGIFVWLSLYVDRIMINHYLTISEVGIYGIGHRLATIAGLVMVGFQGALTPLVYKYYESPDTPFQLARIFRLFILLAQLVLLTLTLFAYDILKVMTTPDFYGASKLIIFLVPAILLGNMYIFSPGIVIAKKTKYIVWINIAGGLINALLNYLLIPLLGVIGAGLATFLSCLVTFSVYTYIGQGLYKIPYEWKKIFLGILITLLFIVFIPNLLLPDFWRWIVNAFCILFFSIYAVFIGLVKKNELEVVLLSLQKILKIK